MNHTFPFNALYKPPTPDFTATNSNNGMTAIVNVYAMGNMMIIEVETSGAVSPAARIDFDLSSLGLPAKPNNCLVPIIMSGSSPVQIGSLEYSVGKLLSVRGYNSTSHSHHTVMLV